MQLLQALAVAIIVLGFGLILAVLLATNYALELWLEWRDRRDTRSKSRNWRIR